MNDQLVTITYHQLTQILTNRSLGSIQNIKSSHSLCEQQYDQLNSMISIPDQDESPKQGHEVICQLLTQISELEDNNQDMTQKLIQAYQRQAQTDLLLKNAKSYNALLSSENHRLKQIMHQHQKQQLYFTRNSNASPLTPSSNHSSTSYENNECQTQRIHLVRGQKAMVGSPFRKSKEHKF